MEIYLQSSLCETEPAVANVRNFELISVHV